MPVIMLSERQIEEGLKTVRSNNLSRFGREICNSETFQKTDFNLRGIARLANSSQYPTSEHDYDATSVIAEKPLLRR